MTEAAKKKRGLIRDFFAALDWHDEHHTRGFDDFAFLIAGEAEATSAAAYAGYRILDWMPIVQEGLKELLKKAKNEEYIDATNGDKCFIEDNIIDTLICVDDFFAQMLKYETAFNRLHKNYYVLQEYTRFLVDCDCGDKTPEIKDERVKRIDDFVNGLIDGKEVRNG